MVPKIALNRYGKRTFKMGSAILWNSINDEHLKQSKDITTFMNQLKMYLFNGYYCSGIVHLLYFMYYLYVTIFMNDQSALSSSPILRKR